MRALKNRLLLVWSVCVLAAALLAGSAAAQVQVFGGPTYNTYSIDWPDELPEDLKIKSGFGAYGGVQYWLNETIALGAQFDYFTGSSSHAVDDEVLVAWGAVALASTPRISLEGRVTGDLARLAVRLATEGNVVVEPFVAAGSYRLRAEGAIEGIFAETASSTALTATLTANPKVGGVAGVTVGFPLASGLTLGGTVGYRHVPGFSSGTVEVLGFEEESTDLEGLNVSGLVLGAALTYGF